MTEATFNTRAKKVGMRKNTVAYQQLHGLLSGSISESRPDISKRRSVRIYTDNMKYYAEKMNIGLCRNNDAPKGGIAGNVCRLTTKGKRQMF